MHLIRPFLLRRLMAKIKTRTRPQSHCWLSVSDAQDSGASMPFNGKSKTRLRGRLLKVVARHGKGASMKSCCENFKLRAIWVRGKHRRQKI